MSEVETTQETIARIDMRQDQLIEDLERLNGRIENIIELFLKTRTQESGESAKVETGHVESGHEQAA